MPAIVVGTDGSPAAERALRRAAALARDSGERLYVVTAIPSTPSYAEPLEGSAKRERVDLHATAEQVAAREAAHAEAEGVEVETVAREGDPAQVLIDVAQEVGADLIVVGARGLTPIERFLLGSVSSKLAHHATCDLLIVREG
jgi:nucleotide-binding universal stress UspA family protein